MELPPTVGAPHLFRYDLLIFFELHYDKMVEGKKEPSRMPTAKLTKTIIEVAINAFKHRRKLSTPKSQNCPPY